MMDKALQARAIFLDRDGVLIKDVDLLTDRSQIQILTGVSQALQGFQQAGYKLIVVSNQTVIARGLLTEEGVLTLHSQLQTLLTSAGAPIIDAWYFCPHHPHATILEYRIDCECRKPKPGMLYEASIEHSINLQDSFMIGDRITDIIAGYRAGCRTVQVQTGMHSQPPIVTTEPLDMEAVIPNYICNTLMEASIWILNQK